MRVLSAEARALFKRKAELVIVARQAQHHIPALDTRAEIATAWSYKQKLNIRTPNTEIAVGTLSGGNQQKVMLAKWLNMNPALLIVDEPTRGIDVGAKAEVHALIRAFVAAGGPPW